MNISCIISSIDETTGGPARSVTNLISSISDKFNFQIDLFCRESETPVIHNFEKPMVGVHFCDYNKLGGLKELSVKLERANPDILHGHGLWQLPIHQMANFARKNNLPYIISPRGMLQPWSLLQGQFKKKIALNLYQYKDLKEASCIHATSSIEVESIRKLGFKNPIAMIPNGIFAKKFSCKNPNEPSGNKKKVLFLSRIHPVKGLELLIDAWYIIDSSLREGWEVEIAGNGQPKYINFIKERIREKGLQGQIRILGPKFGKEKLALYKTADLFVLPTHSENFGIVVAEALASGVPVITTKGTPWKDLNINQSGWWIELGVEPLVHALNEALNMSVYDLRNMGLRGRDLVEKNYSIHVVAGQMMQLYKWVLYGGEKPEFVYEK